MVHLVALDIDGTLLDSRRRLTERTMRAVTELQRRSIAVVLVTGRTFPAARPIAEKLAVSDLLVVAHNGALVKRLDQGEPIASWLLDAETARSVIEAVTERDVNLSCSDDPSGPGRLVLDRPPSERLTAYLRSVGMEPLIVDDLAEFVDHPVIQVSISGPTTTVRSIEQRLDTLFADRISITTTAYPQRDLVIVDVLQPGCSKRTGLDAAVRRMGIAPRDVLAIGDNFNDVEMLRYAGTAVIMANAPEPLHHMGFEVTEDRDRDGAARAIERLVLDSLPKH